MSAQTHLDGLNQAQKEAVLHRDGPLLIVAGAGAGKTRTITHRVAHLMREGIEARRLLALTFTNRAADEMRERVRALVSARQLPLVATFHSLAVRILREFGTRVDVPARFSIWDRDDQLRAVKRVLKELGREKENSRPLLASISKQKGAGVTLAAYAEGASIPWHYDVSVAWERYERELREARALDFDDLLLKVRELLSGDESIRSLLRNRWTHITIDEYQDTSGVQFEIVQLLAGKARNVCVVGDLDQSIYTWRQARLENLLSFERHFPGTKVVRLEDNYRSTGTIIAAANGVIEKNANRLPKTLRPTRESGEPLYLFKARDEEDEAWFVAASAQSLIQRGAPPREIGVLFRTSAQSRALEEAFLHTGVPCRVIGTRFFERKEVKDALAYARGALSEGDPLAAENRADITRIVASPPRGIGETTLANVFAGREAELAPAARAKVRAFRASLLKMRVALESLPPFEAMKFILEESGLERRYRSARDEEERERMRNLRELVNLAVRYGDESPPRGALRLLEEVALESEQDGLKEEDASRVSLMTVHAAKGLEFDTVFVTGLEQRLFPTLKTDEDTDPEEERRLFYVALTRARDRLFLSFARSRFVFGTRKATVPSEFLSDIDPRLLSRAKLAAGDHAHEEETIRY